MKTALRSRLTALTPVAIVFTLVSLCWTGWSITDLVQSGWWGILAAVSVDGLWGVVQYLSYKGIGGRLIVIVEWITLGVACGLLAWHGWSITHAAAFAGALPPIVAKIAWTGDVRLRRDPTALTAEQEAEINSVIRDSEYIGRKRAAEIEREAAEEIALIRAQGKVAIERDEVTFQVELERIQKRGELSRRTPLGIAASSERAIQGNASGRPDAEADTVQDTSGQSDSEPDETSGRDDSRTTPDALTSPDVRPDSPDPLSEIAKKASGPSDLVRALAAHGVRKDDLVSEAVRLRPDIKADSIRRTAKRLGEGPYL
ncbi:hypothetical protein [Streptomyces sp. B21-083]|uniref:hypothetical protein n=1 Tax=Streptomyces sp. B21-083 TaxID=3039410 RepID=UPI002FF1E809